MTANRLPTRDVHLLCLVKGAERYVFIWDDANRPAVLNAIGRFACNPLLSFSWWDAAILAGKIRGETK